MNLKEGDIIAIDKPKGITSHDVVNIIRRATGIKKVGHGGTLDPLATGVLVIAIGRSATKQLDKYVAGEKEYEATIKLGETSTTEDEEGEKTKISGKEPSKDELQDVLNNFTGTITQTPPIYSALKVKGKAAYIYARKGEILNLEPRKVEIKKIELLKYNYPLLTIKVTCGKGVYIRSLARDIGEKLSTGAYLADLRRTRVAEFTLQNAIDLKDLSERGK